MAKKIKAPESLKDFVKLINRIYTLQLCNDICSQIDVKLKPYVLEGVWKEGVLIIFDRLKKVSELFDISDSDTDIYSSVNENNVDISTITKILVEYLPRVLCLLSFIQFHVTEKYKGRGGGTWKQEVESISEEDQIANASIFKWLNDDHGMSSEFFKRGFCGVDINLSGVKNVSNKLKEILDSVIDRHCVFSLHGLLFLTSRWDHSMLASATMLLHIFCRNATENEACIKFFKSIYKEEKFEAFQDTCCSVVENLEHIYDVICPMISGTSRSTDINISSEAMYLYVVWLKRNLKNVIVSLRKLKKDSRKWSEVNLRNALTSGPAKYGFLFTLDVQKARGNVEDYQSSFEMVCMQLSLASLTSPACGFAPESLYDLQRIVDVIQITKSSSIGIIQGVLTTAGIISALTYAITIFGHIDTVKSIMEFPDFAKSVYRKLVSFCKALINFPQSISKSNS
ncbi:hypothetical protein BgAZ_105210 [Babesia gibsoni]|uniref:Uncharacterized protein n=1 Tax=Babesia gibsoni TaxID=33632 RepID=A0AAD8PFR5_BABGI|nr:hypothetical protein BgAZ_105210 [Babesia gibsoni]